MKTLTSIATSIAISFSIIAAPAFASGPKNIESLVDTALTVNSPESPFAGSFDTLISLLVENTPGRGEILASLDSRGQYTVFAPTDDAFEELGETLLTLGYCNLAELDPLIVNEVLLYHVTRGYRDSSDVLSSDKINMISGGKLEQSAAVLTDNLGRTANLIPGAIDVTADNGVIHAIDTVVLPLLPPVGPGGC